MHGTTCYALSSLLKAVVLVIAWRGVLFICYPITSLLLWRK